MAQQLRQKAVQTFTKGLITERGELTFPEDASIDELNCNLDKDGLRRKRLAVQFEAGHEPLHGVSEQQTFFVWENVGGIEGKRVLVCQSEGILFFYNLGEPPYSDPLKRIKLSDQFTEHYFNASGGLPAIYDYDGISFGYNSSISTSVNTNFNLLTSDYYFKPLTGGSGLPSTNSFSLDYRIQFTELNGVLIATHPFFRPIAFVYRPPATTATGPITEEFISPVAIDLKVRDFKWLSYTDPVLMAYDANNLDANGFTTTRIDGEFKYIELDLRYYDALNSGWGPDEFGESGGPRDVGLGPNSGLLLPLTHPWYSGKDLDGNFSLSEWRKVGKGAKGLTANGRFIYNFDDLNRGGPSGFGKTFLSGLLINEVEPWHPSTCAVMQQRVFYAGWKSNKNGGKILFSRVLDSAQTANTRTVYSFAEPFGSFNFVESLVEGPNVGYTGIGECYQRNDPTSEYASDLLPDDGGVIDIPEAYEIKKLVNVRDSIFVFAENGIWIISGQPFVADSYSVEKLTNIGIASPESLVMVGETPFWWSSEGIHTISYNQQSGRADVANLAEQTIQSFYDDINLWARNNCNAVYDEPKKKIHWFYTDENYSFVRTSGSPALVTERSRKNKVLTLDLNHQSFYPWTISDGDDDPINNKGNFVVGAVWYDGYGSDLVNFNVVTTQGGGGVVSVVKDSNDNVVSPQEAKIDTGTSSVLVLCCKGSDGASYQLTVGGFTGTSFYDFNDEVVGGYEAYVESGYDFMGDLLRKKNSPYIITYMRHDEDGFVIDPDTGQYVVDRPQSLLVSSYWDLRKTPSSAPQQCYRYKYPLNTSTPNVFDYPIELMQTRLKMRGHGRVMRMKFEGEVGKDFQLLGYSIVQGVNPRY